MANIKVSEMTEATVFDDGDYAMIVQANQNKKILKENMLNGVEEEIGDLTSLATTDKTDLVSAINENNTNIANITGQILWTNPNPSSPISSTQEISLSSSNYDILEVFYFQTTSGTLSYSSRFLKGCSTRMRIHTSDATNVYRGLTYLSDTSYRIDLPYNDVALSNVNSLAIPIYIIGYKTGLFS